MLGWVAKDTRSYAFPVSAVGPQHATAPDLPDAGDGLRPDGTPLPPMKDEEEDIEEQTR